MLLLTLPGPPVLSTLPQFLTPSSSEMNCASRTAQLRDSAMPDSTRPTLEMQGWGDSEVD
jgi:hypothetical protein